MLKYGRLYKKLNKPDENSPPSTRFQGKYKDYFQFMKSVTQLPLLSFNGQKYDINLNRDYGFHKAVHEVGPLGSCIKKGNSYMSLENEFFKILDITNYLPPCSYDKYLKSYNAQGAKSVFPFKWKII